MSRITKIVTWEEIYKRIDKLPKKARYYGIPRGGAIIAGLTGNAVNTPQQADIIIDDIIDSGRTAEKWFKEHKIHVVSLFNKKTEKIKNWITFPWEVKDETLDIQDTIVRQIEYIGENQDREGLLDTPDRIVKSWATLYGGYKQNPKEILSKVFTQQYDEMVLLKDIEMYSTCEHHMLPFFGKVHIAYIPNGKVVGISKLARLTECFSRRLQIQEKLTNQIVDSIEQELKPKGSACIIEAKHLCMCCRGVQKQNSVMITSALRGVFLKKPEARNEFMGAIK